MIDLSNIINTNVYVKGTDLSYQVAQVHYRKDCENLCTVTLDVQGPPPKEVLERCVSLEIVQHRDFMGAIGATTHLATFNLSDISEVPFGSPLAQVIYGGK